MDINGVVKQIMKIVLNVENPIILEERSKMKREDVYKLIDGERDYQDLRWVDGCHISDAETPVANWVLYIREHLGRASDQIYWLDESAALEDIRKIAALAVACMEYNDTKARK